MQLDWPACCAVFVQAVWCFDCMACAVFVLHLLFAVQCWKVHAKLCCFCAVRADMLCCAARRVQVVLKDFQHAAKAQRASVTPAEIQRYEDYNARHGAQYVQGTADGAGGGDEDEEDW